MLFIGILKLTIILWLIIAGRKKYFLMNFINKSQCISVYDCGKCNREKQHGLDE